MQLHNIARCRICNRKESLLLIDRARPLLGAEGRVLCRCGLGAGRLQQPELDQRGTDLRCQLFFLDLRDSRLRLRSAALATSRSCGPSDRASGFRTPAPSRAPRAGAYASFVHAPDEAGGGRYIARSRRTRSSSLPSGRKPRLTRAASTRPSSARPSGSSSLT